ncbi:HK97 family phage prohead protease [Pedobacter sp. MC2016-24]|uniref:HK97 family phage prohead protease n=1 Tax=Pedobacter sp. MC2016-24 TaxID=2780090 RepID=UPI0018814EB6|nr:HK97 family phage prohead protease [Pedobacter sp. MC2016-24]MBE9598754.1 HK97 family phage prohead protease [Pedobacter sp. MC2016-24]
MAKKLQHKSFEFSNLQVDTESRTISGYASVFNVVDADGDLISKGAFSKTLSENKARIVHLYQHNPVQLLGRPTMLIEDEKGLYFETTIANTQLGDEVLELYRNGTIKEHSIGFQTVKSTNRGTYNEISEVKLFEFSSVTWGSNSQAQFTGFKGQFTSDSIVENCDKIMKMLKSEVTNDTIDQLNIFLNQIKTTHLHLTEKSVTEDSDPLEDSQDTDNPMVIEEVVEVKNNDLELIQSFIKGYKNEKLTIS